MPSNLKYAIGLVFILILVISSCKDEPELKEAQLSWIFEEPAMIVNESESNLVEGTYIEAVEIDSPFVELSYLPQAITENSDKWLIGWSDQEPLYDAGFENTSYFHMVDSTTLKLTRQMLGSGFPEKGQNLVFWNTDPSDFKKYTSEPVLYPPEMFDGFNSNSSAFGDIVYDSSRSTWIMYICESDVWERKIYAAESKDLRSWQAANNGKAVLTFEDFAHTSWAGYGDQPTKRSAPVPSDIFRQNNKWHITLYGYNSDGVLQTGLMTTKDLINGPFNVKEDPIIPSGTNGSWEESGAYYSKSAFRKDTLLTFYCGLNSDDQERLGLAWSTDLKEWHKSEMNPLMRNRTGWSSAPIESEPCYVEVREDKVLLAMVGAKEMLMGPWHHYVTGRMYMDRPGNPWKAQLGLYHFDDSKKLVEHRNNPVFVADYSTKLEQYHLGGNFQPVQHNDTTFVFYQSKGVFNGNVYNIFLRFKAH